MAATPSFTRRPPSTRGTSIRKLVQNASTFESPSISEPPLKKRRESRRERAPARPRFSSAAAAAAAVVHGDGFKPREERGWEEFHQDLDIEAKFPVYSSWEVDGIKRPVPKSSLGDQELANVEGSNNDGEGDANITNLSQRTPPSQDEAYNSASPTASGSRRRPGRPFRRADSMLKGIGTPEVPKLIPLPGFNPREKLTLPKPSFRSVDPFEKFEEKGLNRVNYVDKAMSAIGYQESEIYVRPEHSLIRVTEGNIEDDIDHKFDMNTDGESDPLVPGSGFGRVEYDMDEQDTYWLEAINEQRGVEQCEAIKPAIFEATMTKIEKEWYALEKRIPKPNPKPPQTHRPRSSSAAAVNGELAAPGEEQDSKCAICDDGDCENTNAIVFCDGCDLAVHQECYGVPFIPEGQWLCRKCQLIGRGTPTCIFCPNTDGAFKQTNASRWSHLLCAIWIPEVSIGNTTFMEPVMDVEKVPKPRWRLTCYICRQKMGACVQCGNKNCYIAFHVTCARRARLFLKMKSAHGGPASLDASVLKAFCDKHVPAEWRRDQNVDNAIVDAMEYYRRAMRGRLWADSQQSALTIMPAPSQDHFPTESIEEPSDAKITLKFSANGRNKVPKIVWRLPSGAPVIPQTVYDAVDNALQRSAIRKRKEFDAEMCKYWTLKREARRGAALLKRLQLQMETFTSMEITRRNFVGMGAAGNVRLQRRIDFADSLLEDVGKLRQICAIVKEREDQKREDAYALKEIIDTVYFPLAPLLRPIIRKAQAMDSKGVFECGLSAIQEKVNRRMYLSVTQFVEDLEAAMNKTGNETHASHIAEAQISPGVTSKNTLSQDEKQRKALVKRVLRSVHNFIEAAKVKETELLEKPTVQDAMNGDTSPRPTAAHHHVTTNAKPISNGSRRGTFAISETSNGDIDPAISELSLKKYHNAASKSSRRSSRRSAQESPPLFDGNGAPPTDMSLTNGIDHTRNSNEPARSSTSDLGTSDEHVALSHGGVPWYMVPFDPQGSTISEEKPVVIEDPRAASEELSEMDEEQLEGLVDDGKMMKIPIKDTVTKISEAEAQAAAKAKKRKAAARLRRRQAYG